MEMVRLENIVFKGYDRQTGEPVIEETTEYTCPNCRFLIDKNDKYCWSCRVDLSEGKAVEHYSMGRKFTDSQYDTIRQKRGREMISAILSLPPEVKEKKVTIIDE